MNVDKDLLTEQIDLIAELQNTFVVYSPKWELLEGVLNLLATISNQ